MAKRRARSRRRGWTAEDWIKAAIVAGAALVIGKVIYDSFKNYNCPRCKYPVSRDINTCPNCGLSLDWRGVP